jgi:cytochrome c oxidase accessory protein FixG
MNEEELLKGSTYRDRVSTVDNSGSRNWVYASKPKGKFTNWRNLFNIFYLLIFFTLPLIYINGAPVVLFNFPEAKFIIFTKIFWPQDFFIFAVSMVAGIVFVALFTVIYGRLFCGWACPQTVFMEFVFRKIEWWIEGSPNEQKKLNKARWNVAKVRKKLLKHTVFLAISFLISHTFLAYIFGFRELRHMMSEPMSSHTGLVFGLVIFTLLFYGVFAYVRDIVCTTICPYGRLQGVLFDNDTIQIAYDYNRGEERALLNKKETRTAGDCIDCHKCVQVCPTGIDIRNGLQMECVGCTACIDACDEVMEKIGFEKGLIRYASENEISGKGKFHFNKRMKAYSVLLAGLLLFITYLIASRNPVDTIVSRVKGQLYQEVGSDTLSNLFSARIINKTRSPKEIMLKVSGGKGHVRIIGDNLQLISGESQNEITFFVELPNTEIKMRKTNLSIEVYANNELIETKKTTFLGPFK